jgi:hypothetical protein
MGIIAEDDSDVAVLRALTLELLRPEVIGFKKFVSGGCGKLRRKCGAWARILVRQGCDWVVLVHDLDQFDEVRLRAELTASIATCGALASVVLIPRREIEAWLLYDAVAIATAFNETSRPKLPGNPENIADPKKHLRQLIRNLYEKHYINTLHNPLIARNIKTTLLRNSRSFLPHFNFMQVIAATL